jgi:hypothetical protein
MSCLVNTNRFATGCCIRRSIVHQELSPMGRTLKQPHKCRLHVCWRTFCRQPVRNAAGRRSCTNEHNSPTLQNRLFLRESITCKSYLMMNQKHINDRFEGSHEWAVRVAIRQKYAMVYWLTKDRPQYSHALHSEKLHRCHLYHNAAEAYLGMIAYQRSGAASSHHFLGTFQKHVCFEGGRAACFALG